MGLRANNCSHWLCDVLHKGSGWSNLICHRNNTHLSYSTGISGAIVREIAINIRLEASVGSGLVISENLLTTRGHGGSGLAISTFTDSITGSCDWLPGKRRSLGFCSECPFDI